MKTIRILAVLAAAAGVAFGAGASAADQDRTRDRGDVRQHDRDPDQDRLRLRDQVQKDLKLTDAEVATLDPELTAVAKRGGNQEQVREMLREAHGEGCRGLCLAQALRSMNQAAAQGVGDEQARHMVEAAIEQEVRARKHGAGADKELGEKVRSRVEQELRVRDRTHGGTGGPGAGGSQGTGGHQGAGGSPGGGMGGGKR